MIRRFALLSFSVLLAGPVGKSTKNAGPVVSQKQQIGQTILWSSPLGPLNLGIGRGFRPASLETFRFGVSSRF
jgi:hypothetical protein